jgi:hypothetical protein
MKSDFSGWDFAKGNRLSCMRESVQLSRISKGTCLNCCKQSQRNGEIAEYGSSEAHGTCGEVVREEERI